MKKTVFFFLCSLLVGSLNAQTSVRSWIGVSETLLFSPEFSLNFSATERMEHWTTDAKGASNFYYLEAGITPSYAFKWDALKLTLGLSGWYYLYYGTVLTDKLLIDFVPSLTYSLGNLAFSLRLLLTNTIYSDMYAADKQLGYSLFGRLRLGTEYTLIEKTLSIFLQEEIFYGLIENANVVSSPKGFNGTGLYNNRVYLGMNYTILPDLKAGISYIMENGINLAKNPSITSYHSNITLMISHSVKLY